MRGTDVRDASRKEKYADRLRIFTGPDTILMDVGADDIPLFDGRLFLKVRSLSDLLLKTINRCIVHFEEHLQAVRKISEGWIATVNS